MFFRKKREQQPQPTWLKWAVLAFIVLAIISNNHRKTNGEPTPLENALHKTAADIENNKTVNFAELKNRITTDYVPLRAQDIKPGKGPPVVCGQTVAIAYQSFSVEGKTLEDKADKDKPLRFTVGEGAVMPALEEGVIDMKPGGKRRLTSPPAMAYGSETFARKDMPADAPVRFEVELLSATPALPENAPYRIAVKQEGQGSTIGCGQSVQARVTIWTIDGVMVFTTKEPIRFTPGKSEIFMGLEQGVLGMREQGSARTLIVPPAYQKTLNGNAPAVDFPFPKAQTVLVEVETQ